MSKPVLGLDLDGVIYNWQEAAYIYLVDNNGYKGTYEELWCSNSFWHSKSPLFADNLIRIENLYYKFPPSFKTQECMKKIGEKREIVYITYRPIETEFVTRNFLEDFDFPNYDNVIHSNNKSVDVRYTGCQEFVEDRWEIAEEIAELCDVMLMAQPWNDGHRSKFKTVYSLYDVERMLV